MLRLFLQLYAMAWDPFSRFAGASRETSESQRTAVAALTLMMTILLPGEEVVSGSDLEYEDELVILLSSCP